MTRISYFELYKCEPHMHSWRKFGLCAGMVMGYLSVAMDSETVVKRILGPIVMASELRGDGLLYVAQKQLARYPLSVAETPALPSAD